MGTLGGMPEVKHEGEVFLEKNETTEGPRPLKFLNADQVHYAPFVYFSFLFLITLWLIDGYLTNCS